MKHVKPYLMFEAKEVNPVQQSFLAELRAKLEGLGISWHNLASPRSQKLGTVELNFSPRDAWSFVQESGWEQGLKPLLLKKFESDFRTVRESGFADELAEQPDASKIYLYVQSSGMRGADRRTGQPAVSPMYQFRDGLAGAKGAFQVWLLRELLGEVRSKKIQLINAAPTPEVLRKYALDPDSTVRLRVTASPDLPEDVIIQLSRDRDPVVQGFLIDRQSLSAQAIANLAKSRDPFVRQRLAALPNLPEEIVLSLSKDRDQNVRDALAANLHLIQNRELKGYGWSDDDIALARQLGL